VEERTGLSKRQRDEGRGGGGGGGGGAAASAAAAAEGRRRIGVEARGGIFLPEGRCG